MLRERISLIAFRNVQSQSGAMIREEVELNEVRAYRVRQTYRVDRDGLVSKEEFSPYGLRFLVRYDPTVEKATEIGYRGDRFRIAMKEYNVSDRSYTLYVERVNK